MNIRLNINKKNIENIENIVSEILQKIEIELSKHELKKDEKLFLSSNYLTLLNFQKRYKNQIQEDFL